MLMCVCVQSGKALAIGIGSLTLEGGGTVESLDLDFTLIGFPNIPLKVCSVYSVCICSLINLPSPYSLEGRTYL